MIIKEELSQNTFENRVNEDPDVDEQNDLRSYQLKLLLKTEQNVKAYLTLLKKENEVTKVR